MPSPDLIAKLTALANSSDPEVKAWIGRHLAFDIREDRPKRRRGMDVTLARTNRRVKLDAARVKQLMRDGE